MKNTTAKTRWLARLLSGSCSAALGCTGAGPVHPEKTFAAWPAELPLMDRNLVACPLTQQARNGAIIEATVFNFHFQAITETIDDDTGITTRVRPPEPTADLLPASTNLIQRLARRYECGNELWLFVQTAKDVPKKTETWAAWAKKRDQLNRERIQAVAEYVAAIRPDLVARVNLIDLDEVGMPGTEAAKGQLGMIDNTHGVLRPDTYDPRVGGLNVNSSSGPIAPPAGPPDLGAAPGGLNPGG